MVGIFLPASPVREPFRANGAAALQAMGLTVREPQEPCSSHQGFLSRPPEQTADELAALAADPRVKAMWAGRGGYGSNLLLPLPEGLFTGEAKILIGSSDVSYLLWQVLEQRDWVVFYGPMVYSTLAEGRADTNQLWSVLSGEAATVSGRTLLPGRAAGVVTGGCLSNLVSLIGTPFLPRTADRVLLLEDVNERPYRLDRMFWQLQRSGILPGVSALLLGEFPGCFLSEAEKRVFLERTAALMRPLGVPVVYDLPLGHAACCRTVPLGVEAAVEAGESEGLIHCQQGVVP